ncbi:hypothetical protein BOX37_08595 [Nocardia mangyaensis]|uniref:Polyketide cyclase n=1 Tax=Nocardia mangyaensis TaxID=2213200 RepID=A0A1J0VPT2_9NOCA|nr:hypothetical protein [Nocardia mangyaensis]APE34022.1 hypothetical protein BOX37_08595 [Nocardia mangyaensis]
MHVIGSRKRNQPAPPHAIFESLTNPDRDPTRPWLNLLRDEQRPTVLDSTYPHFVVWSSLWPRRPDARLQFDLPSDGGSGTDLRWTLYVDDPLPDDSTTGHLRHRIDKLINANLRRSYGQ